VELAKATLAETDQQAVAIEQCVSHSLDFMRKVRNEFGYVEFCKRGIAMKIPFLSRKSKQLSEQQIDAAMERLRRLRIEVALVELETELRRSEVRVLHPPTAKKRISDPRFRCATETLQSTGHWSLPVQAGPNLRSSLTQRNRRKRITPPRRLRHMTAHCTDCSSTDGEPIIGTSRLIR